jgi:hypothetical protein
MKIATSFLAGLLLIGGAITSPPYPSLKGLESNRLSRPATLGAIDTAMGSDEFIYKQEFTPDSYCHLKYPTTREETVAGDHSVLQDPRIGDIIASYGPCDEDPLGKDQVHE